jgi:hypothetical protein
VHPGALDDGAGSFDSLVLEAHVVAHLGVHRAAGAIEVEELVGEKRPQADSPKNISKKIIAALSALSETAVSWSVLPPLREGTNSLFEMVRLRKLCSGSWPCFP